ncbi:helix-turn-helix domain-containing protein [Nonlabens ponticola]|uniref:DNA-binding protein n=1 Tax=Nonlabens ponticola TaxID=2496866 RepID=A0A3S9N0A1_9FLAO|nr:helix-turn-helix domain-containing protein [Nonlabens ponticola]AZQ44850.1 DNA-binding protein [Nonlabens ponticola]
MSKHTIQIKELRIENLSAEQLFTRIEEIVDAKIQITLSKKEQPEHKSLQQLAAANPVCVGTLRNYIKSGKLKAFKIGDRVFVKNEDFDKAMSEIKSKKYKR